MTTTTPRPIQPEDFLKYRTISRPHFSPDGSLIACSVHQANKEDNLYNGDIILVNSDGSGSTRLTYGGKDSNPKFSPDGKNLLFLTKRTLEKDEKGNELYIMAVSGAQARRLVKKKEGIEAPAWSQDSREIYFISKVVDKQEEDEEKDGVKLVRGYRWWFNGEGFVHNQRSHLFLVNVESGQVHQLTSGAFDVGAFELSHDGKRLAYLASIDDTRPYITDLLVANADGSQAIKVTKSDMEIASVVWSPDDNELAINAAYYFPRGFASNSHIWTVEPKEGASLKKIENVDLNKANSLNSDARAGAHGAGSISWKKDSIYYPEGHGGSVHLFKVRPGGSPELIVGGEKSVEDFTVSNQGKVAYVSMDGSHLPELRIWDGSTERQLTNLNQSVYEELEILAPEHFTFQSSDGAIIDCWILAKKEEERNEKIPTILYVHGGPKTAFGNSYMHEFQTFAAKGYAVLYANIRGSDGYSEEFADLRGHYGERDYKDLLEVVENACQKYPFIDRARLGIAGGSYGGFMTNWAVGHTELFRAAVTDRSIASWESFFGTSDIGPYFTKDQIGNDPFAGRDDLARMSPITYVSKIKTPVLIVHSMEDYRCWMVEGLQMYTALKYLGKETEMVLFTEENHDLSRVGKPRHRISRLNHYLRWFDKHLK